MGNFRVAKLNYVSILEFEFYFEREIKTDQTLHRETGTTELWTNDSEYSE